MKKWDSEPAAQVSGMVILVAEGSSHQDVQNLVENLTQDSAGKNVRIRVFDSRDAWQVYERESQLVDKELPSEISDEEYGRRVNPHWLIEFLHTAQNTQEVRWMAEESKSPVDRAKDAKPPKKLYCGERGPMQERRTTLTPSSAAWSPVT